jgi:phenylalanyl-tRNA synthetase beta chain
MKVSLNWLRKYLDLRGFSPESIASMLTDLGLEVEGIERFESIKGGLKGVVVGEVKQCWKHPNAEKLSLTKVDVGDGDWLQIVCGAPNVKTGQKVLVAKVGTTLYPTTGETLTLEERKVRGEISKGMICAEDELGLGSDHSGIIDLPPDAKVGTLARDYFDVWEDIVYEIGLTPNRTDATCHLGVARDLAASLKINYAFRGNVDEPDISKFSVENDSAAVKVFVEDQVACPRYSGLGIAGVKVAESPSWLKNLLLSIGVRPINNVVDATNFVLHELGQPLHAFDLDQIAGRKIVVKTLNKGTDFQALDGATRKLSDDDLMICDGNSNPMCIGGVFGGAHSGVTEATTRIFLESAHFNPKFIRHSKNRHDLHTDAAFIFEKGSDPNITVFALKRAALLITELTGGQVASEIIDIYPNPVLPRQVRLYFKNIDRLIGYKIDRATIREILLSLNVRVIGEPEGQLLVEIPTNKVDVTREADLIEEILRVYGLNKIPIPSQVRSSLVLSEKPNQQRLRNSIAEILAANGFHEMMALSLSESKYYKQQKPNLVPEQDLVFVNNTSNAQLDIMRPAMVFSGLEAIVRNQNRQSPDLKLFEFGKTYHRCADNQFEERNHLSLFVSGKRTPLTWLKPGEEASDFFTLKGIVSSIIRKLGIAEFQQQPIENDLFQFGMTYKRGDQVLVQFGKLHPRLLQDMEIRNEVFYADFDWDNLTTAFSKTDVKFVELNRHPIVLRDLALVLDTDITFEKIATVARSAENKLLTEVTLFDVFANEEKLGKGKKSYAVRFEFVPKERTLSDAEVDNMMRKLTTEFETKLGALIRR